MPESRWTGRTSTGRSYGLANTIGRANLDGTGVNQSFISTANGPCGVAVDALTSARPTTTINLSPASPDGQNGWYRSAVHVTVSASENAGGSGIAATRCVLDPASPPASFDEIPSVCPYLGGGADVTGNGQHTLYAASVDNAGNKEMPVSASFKIDTTPPTVTCNAPASTFVLGGAGRAGLGEGHRRDLGAGGRERVRPPDMSSAGQKSVALSGFDNAGNETTVSCPYTVAAAAERRDHHPRERGRLRAGAGRQGGVLVHRVPRRQRDRVHRPGRQRRSDRHPSARLAQLHG